MRSLFRSWPATGEPSGKPLLPGTLSSEDRKFILESWREEAMALLDHERAITGSGARALAASLTLLGIGVAYGVAGEGAGHTAILFALPPVLALIGIELMQNFGDALAVIQGRRELEMALQVELGVDVPVLIYARRVHAQRHRLDGRWFAGIAVAIYPMMMLALAVLVFGFVPATFPNAATVKTVAFCLTTVSYVGFVGLLVDNLSYLPPIADPVVGAIVHRAPTMSSEPGRLSRGLRIEDDLSSGQENLPRSHVDGSTHRS
jgi:hypothetical protein